MNKQFYVEKTDLEGVWVIQRNYRHDERGSFARVFCSEAFTDLGWKSPIKQINHSITQGVGTVRGIHFQRPPFAEKKIVSCLRGRVWDVVVDIRRNSPTFLRWHSQELSDENGLGLFIPEGCAHGFQVIEAGAEMFYLHSMDYSPNAEGGLHPLDPYLGLPWPRDVENLSPRDQQHPFIDEFFDGLLL